MSYAIYFDDELVASGSVSTADPFLEPHLQLEENAAGTFEFKIPPNHEAYDDIAMMKTEVRVYLHEENDVPDWIGFATNIEYDFWMNKKVTCEGCLMILSTSVTRQGYYHGYTPEEFIEDILNVHDSEITAKNKRFYVGDITVTGSTNQQYVDYITVYEALDNVLLDNFGGVLYASWEQDDSGYWKKYLNYKNYDDFSKASQTVELGKNLMDLSIGMEAEDICTVVIPVGKAYDEDDRTSAAIDGLTEYRTMKNLGYSDVDYVMADDDVISTFGKIWKVVKYERMKLGKNLEKYAKQYLKSYQFANLVLTCKAIDLSMSEDDFEQYHLSDLVQVVSDYHGLDATFRITSMDYYLESPEQNTITLGNSCTQTLTKMIMGVGKGKFRMDASGTSFSPSIHDGTDDDDPETVSDTFTFTESTGTLTVDTVSTDCTYVSSTGTLTVN